MPPSLIFLATCYLPLVMFELTFSLDVIMMLLLTCRRII